MCKIYLCMLKRKITFFFHNILLNASLYFYVYEKTYSKYLHNAN